MLATNTIIKYPKYLKVGARNKKGKKIQILLRRLTVYHIFNFIYSYNILYIINVI